jgi:hypothetical protein
VDHNTENRSFAGFGEKGNMTIRVVAVVAVVLSIIVFVFIKRALTRLGGGSALFHWSVSGWEHERSLADLEETDQNSAV